MSGAVYGNAISEINQPSSKLNYAVKKTLTCDSFRNGPMQTTNDSLKMAPDYPESCRLLFRTD